MHKGSHLSVCVDLIIGGENINSNYIGKYCAISLAFKALEVLSIISQLILFAYGPSML